METTNLKFVETHAMNIPIKSAFNWFRVTDKIQMLKFKDEDSRQRRRTQSDDNNSHVPLGQFS